SGNWGLNAEATSLGLYGSSWVGMMGSTLAPTDDPDVVRVDLDALDFYGENTYPTYLYFNSGSQDATVSLPVEGTHDVYDAISDRIVTDDATVSAPVDVPAGHAAVVVVVPGDSALVHEGNVTKVNGHAVGYATSQGRDLALGRVATASQGPSAAVVDDSRLTSWSATTGASVVVDLATTRTVNEVTASWGARPAARWTVDTSVDGTSWSQAADVAGAAGAQTTTFTPRAARLVRLKLTDAEPTADLTSLEVRQRNLAIGAPVTVSTTANDVHRPEGVTDGSTATRWESATADPQWVTVDLGSSRPVGDVVVRWEAAAAKSYLVQVSQDGSAWTTASTVEGTGGDQTTALPEGTTARYVRVYGTSRLTKYAYSLWELEVYGAIGTATVAPSATETTLSVMPSSVPVGVGATATARVTVPGADVPGGRVDLLADGRTVASAPTGPNGEVQLTVPASLSVGSHVLRAVFVPSDAVTWASSTSAAVAFSVRASGVSSLSSIRVGGTALAGFTPTKHTYTLTLPAGTTKAPTVTVTTTDPGA
ncbi:MAG TPA: discoidin domain-containing protein, partial [Cellulomonas sp.]|nr:discoidin domain-containing protein [Cellulomonas sp.]